MHSDFEAVRLKRAKRILIKKLEYAQDQQQIMKLKVPKKYSWWHRLKLRLFGS
ncbi:MAG: hypothetical protein U9Q90_11070 [Campylobacterota bacterium]|nr:hypothetical protein [Campylobacterota bacterium]